MLLRPFHMSGGVGVCRVCVCPTMPPQQAEICLATKTGCAVVRFEHAQHSPPCLPRYTQVPARSDILQLREPTTITSRALSVIIQKRLMWLVLRNRRVVN